MHVLKPTLPNELVIRFETEVGAQMQVDWVEFRKSRRPLFALSATLGYSRASYVEFVSDMKVATLIACHEHAYAAFGGVPRRVLYDNMKTVILERDAYGEGEHRYHAGFLNYARHCGFVLKLSHHYRAKTKGKVERYNDRSSRYCGEEFIVVLKEVSPEQAASVLERLRGNVESHGFRRSASSRSVSATP
jgi:transposase